jgi:hypothetical protein
MHAGPANGAGPSNGAVKSVVNGWESESPPLHHRNPAQPKEQPPPGFAGRHMSAEERGFAVADVDEYDDEPATCG